MWKNKIKSDSNWTFTQGIDFFHMCIRISSHGDRAGSSLMAALCQRLFGGPYFVPLALWNCSQPENMLDLWKTYFLKSQIPNQDISHWHQPKKATENNN